MFNKIDRRRFRLSRWQNQGAYCVDLLESRRLLVAIASDQTVNSSIAVVGEIDEYTFSASIGDVVIATLAEQAPTAYDPAIELRAPDGTLVISDFTNFEGVDGLGADFITGGLTQNGTYTLRVSDNGGNDTGDYTLTMAKLAGAQSPNDGHGGAIASGERRDAGVGLGDLDVYTFTANSGESVILTTVEPAATGYDPYTIVYGPGGAFLIEDFTNFGGDDGLGNDIFFAAPSNGTYYVVVMDLTAQSGAADFDFEAGTYSLRMVRLPGAQNQDDADGGAIASGERRDGTIALGDLDVFTFTANAGEPVIITTVEPAASLFDPYTIVYGPNGAEVAEDFTNFAGDDGLGNDIFFTTASSGTYYVVVSDITAQSGSSDFDFEPGIYSLRMVKLPGAQLQDDADGGAIASGQRKDGTSALGDLDVFTFTANAGEPVIVTTAEDSPTGYDPYTIVYGPTGALAGQDFSNFEGVDGLGNDIFFTAASSGTHYVVVMDYTLQSGNSDFDFDAGFYSLRMVKLPGAQMQDDSNGGVISSGQRREGSIPLGDMDVYTFGADAGDSILAVVTNFSTVPGYEMRAFLYGPSGALLETSAGTGDDSTVVAIAATSGTHYLLVIDDTNDSGGGDFDVEAGEYALSVAVAPGSQLTDPDSGPLASGNVRAGAVSRGDIDVYTISATAGVAFTLNLAETGTTPFGPALRLISPTGVVAFNSSHASALSAVVSNPPVSGTYTAFVFDAGGAHSGAYSVALNTATGADTFAPSVLGAEYRFDDPQANLRVRLSEDVGATFDFTDVQIIDRATNLPVPDFGLSTSYDATGDLFTVTFPGFDGRVLADGNYRLAIDQNSLTDPSGNPLSANIAFEFFVFAGDANRDRIVDIADFARLAGRFNRAGTFSQGDFNYDAIIDIGDFAILAAKFNATLPAPADAPRVTPTSPFAATNQIGQDQLGERWIDEIMNANLLTSN